MYASVPQKLSEIWPETWMYQFVDFCDFVKKTRHFLQNTVLDKKLVFRFLAISPAIFDLQRHTISHFNPLNISFWPCFITFSAKMDIWWDTKRRKCLVFPPRLYLNWKPHNPGDSNVHSYESYVDDGKKHYLLSRHIG